jgi:hypothetical protein
MRRFRPKDHEAEDGPWVVHIGHIEEQQHMDDKHGVDQSQSKASLVINVLDIFYGLVPRVHLGCL